jgi:hypothetical protein
VDLFAPFVGLSRDGTRYLTVGASPATSHAPISQRATYRQPGVPMVGGQDEVEFLPGLDTYEKDVWGSVGSVVADPADGRIVWAIYPGLHGSGSSPKVGGLMTRLKGGLTGDPGGSFRIGEVPGWTAGAKDFLRLSPDLGSPIQRVRWSLSPDVDVTADGLRLTNGDEGPSQPSYAIDLEDPGIGGTPGSSYTVYVQWRTQDGRWSDPISQTTQVDNVRPVISSFVGRFKTGKVGKSAPLDFSWDVSDVGSGIRDISFSYNARNPTSSWGTTFPPTVTHAAQRLTLKSDYQYGLSTRDLVGRVPTTNPTSRKFTVQAAQGSATGIRYHGTWGTISSSAYLGGSTRYSTRAGATVTYTFTGRAIGFVSTKSKARGKAAISVDGVHVATIDLYSSKTKYRRLVWSTVWAASGTHKVVIEVLHTKGRTRIDADAFVRF